MDTTISARTSGRAVPVAAGILWAAQAAIWLLAPKVQAAEPPHPIINRPMFVIVWLSLAGAVGFSVVALLRLLHDRRGPADDPGRADRIATGAGRLALGGSVAVAAVVLLAASGWSAALSVLGPALQLSGVSLAVSLCVAGFGLRWTPVLPGRSAGLPAVLAGLTLLTLVAVTAAGAVTAMLALGAAAGVVVTLGACWILLALSRRPVPPRV